MQSNKPPTTTDCKIKFSFRQVDSHQRGSVTLSSEEVFVLVLEGNITVAITNEINLNRKIISHPLHCAHAQTYCYLHSDGEVTHLACKYIHITARQRSVCLAAVSDQYIISPVLSLQSLFFPAYISTFTPSTASTQLHTFSSKLQILFHLL